MSLYLCANLAINPELIYNYVHFFCTFDNVTRIVDKFTRL